jgi:hypothetical protein
MHDKNDDLSSKIFYKVQFVIETKPQFPDVDMLWEIIKHIKKWATLKKTINAPQDLKLWTALKYGGKLCDTVDESYFTAVSLYRKDPEDEENISWACMMKECQYKDHFAPRFWTTEVGFQTLAPRKALISIVVSYGDAMGFIGETQGEPDVTVPRLVPSIQDDERFACSLYNDAPLLLNAIELCDGDGEMITSLIFDPERKIPVVLIMPQKDSNNPEGYKLGISPEAMLKSVAGNALVYYSTSLDFVKELSGLLESEYRVKPGMIRLYLPIKDRNNPSDYIRHRFINYYEAAEMGEDLLTKIFRRVLAQDRNDYDKLFRFQNCQELIRRDSVRRRLEEERRKREALIESNEQDQSEFWEEYERVLKENDDLEEQVSDLEADLFQKQSQIDSMMQTYNANQVMESVFREVREMEEYPQDPREILEFFTTVFPDRIDMTERGWKSLENCRTAPQILWKALYSMVTELYTDLETCRNFSEAASQYINSTNFRLAITNSEATKKDKDLSKNYIDSYHGQEIDISPHICSSTGKEKDDKFLRVYFATVKKPGDKGWLIVIGSCGEHLDTAGTKYQSKK